METIVINIKGMTCMGCVRSVKNVLEPVSGVSSVDVSLEAGQATIKPISPNSRPPFRMQVTKLCNFALRLHGSPLHGNAVYLSHLEL
jgi:cation transport ATPase